MFRIIQIALGIVLAVVILMVLENAIVGDGSMVSWAIDLLKKIVEWIAELLKVISGKLQGYNFAA